MVFQQNAYKRIFGNRLGNTVGITLQNFGWPHLLASSPQDAHKYSKIYGKSNKL